MVVEGGRCTRAAKKKGNIQRDNNGGGRTTMKGGAGKIGGAKRWRASPRRLGGPKI